MKGFNRSKTSYDLLVVDGQHITHSSASASDLRTRAGKPTGGTVGCLRRVGEMVQRFKPKYCVVLFDKGKKAERSRLMKGLYKKDSETDPVKLEIKKKFKEELNEQVAVLMEAFPKLNVYAVGLTGMEADDGAAILPYVFEGRSMVASADKDWLQIVGENVDYYNYLNDTVVTLDTWDEYIPFIEKDERVRVAHEEWLLYRAIVGDPSDKVPGLNGLGKIAVAPMVSGCTDIHQLIDKMSEELDVSVQDAWNSANDLKLKKGSEEWVNAVTEHLVKQNKKSKKLAKVATGVDDVEKYIKVMDLRSAPNDSVMVESCCKQFSKCVPNRDIEVFKDICEEHEIYSIVKQVNVFAAKFASLKR